MEWTDEFERTERRSITGTPVCLGGVCVAAQYGCGGGLFHRGSSGVPGHSLADSPDGGDHH